MVRMGVSAIGIDTLAGAGDHAGATLGSGDDEAMATRIVLTYADLVAMPADGKRHELHEGEIYMTAAPRPRHQQVVGNLYLILTAHVPALGLGEVFLSPIDVILADVTVVEPDLIYLDAARLGRVSDRGIEGPPTLAIEVLSPTTAAADRGVKLQLSAKYGVPHYWIADPLERWLCVHRWEPHGYLVALTAGEADIVRAEPFEAVELRVAALFGLEDDEE